MFKVYEDDEDGDWWTDPDDEPANEDPGGTAPSCLTVAAPIAVGIGLFALLLGRRR
jgi:hypothetical protein